MANGKRFGVLLTAPYNEYVEKKHGGYFDLFQKLLREEGETWEVFRVVDGEFPAVEELHNFAGFVVTGSRFDAHGNDLWILKLCRLLKTLHAMRIKVLGICFGHQILCRALGGKTGRAFHGWDLGMRKLKISQKLSARYSTLKIPSAINVLECHRDQVYKAPVGAQVLASSNKTRIEVFGLGDHILGIQGHPEYTNDILLNIIDKILDKNTIKEKIIEDAKASITNKKDDYEIWEKICKLFLKA